MLPWEQLGNESPEAFSAFCRYRDGSRPRSIRTTAERIGKSRSLLFRWSTRYDWQARVAAWDAALAAHNEGAHEQAARIGHYRRQLVDAAQLMRRAVDDPKALDDLPLKDAYQLLIAAVRVFPQLARAEREIILTYAAGDESRVHPVERMTRAEMVAYLTGGDDERSRAEPPHRR